MNHQQQNNDLASVSEAERIRLILSEQFTIMRCSAVPTPDSPNHVNCEMPNCNFRLADGSLKRIKRRVINVPIGFLNGSNLVFESIHGVLLCSNYPTEEIEEETIADMSIVNITGNKCLFIPAFYENELAQIITAQASQRYNIRAPKITIGNGGDTELITLESDQYQILITLITALRDNLPTLFTGSVSPGPGNTALVAACNAAIDGTGGVTLPNLTDNKSKVDQVKV